MVNMTIVLGVLLGQLVKIIFLGTLRDPEVEVQLQLLLNALMRLHFSRSYVIFLALTQSSLQHLNERIWPTITDTLLMMTIFRDEIGFQWGALFGVLIFFRVFAWLAADRVAYIEVNPNMPRGSYIRVRLRGKSIHLSYYFVVAASLYVVPIHGRGWWPHVLLRQRDACKGPLPASHVRIRGAQRSV